MCTTCGCGDGATATLTNLQTGATTTLTRDHAHGSDHVPHDHAHDDHTHDDHTHDDHAHEHVHADGTRHSHSHEHDHPHHHHAHAEAHAHAHHPGAPANIVELEARVLAKNDAIAARNRAWLVGREILALNLVSSPGAGKTTLLERTIRDLSGELDLFVVEGDQATDADGARIRAAGAPAIQVNTGTGCHLEADMVARAIAELKPGPGAVLMIENVGNLVCPALFDLGERAKVAILSVTEGDDKPLKYPHMFRAADVCVINKIDLLPHVPFDMARCVANARAVNPGIHTIQVSAQTGEGLDLWYEWLRSEHTAVAHAAFAQLSPLGVSSPASRPFPAPTSGTLPLGGRP